MARSSKVAVGKTSKHSSAQLNIDIQVERWPIERLIPRVNNPRTHSREQVARIAASIREFGFTNPILVGAGPAPHRCQGAPRAELEHNARPVPRSASVHNRIGKGGR